MLMFIRFFLVTDKNFFPFVALIRMLVSFDSVLTADAFQEDQQAAMDAGMQGHIAKPVDLKQMMETLEQVLR